VIIGNLYLRGVRHYLVIELPRRNNFMKTVSKKQLHGLIEALPETESIAAKRFLEFVLSFREGEEYFSGQDLAEIEEGFARIQQGEYVDWEEFKQRHGL